MFYKLLEDGSLTYGPYVVSENYKLNQEEHETYTYPVDGWYWFETLEEANAFFGLPLQEQNE